ncbi:MAG: hypothetical protein JWN39_3346, partial [Ilumatobacteraceae bacterium]|nr:hypothetical protein [Ilumatobacteraceae bacterium]
AYAYSYVFFTSTVVYALVRHTADWTTLQDELGAWLTVHSVMMVVAGALLGVSIVRAHVLPRWTGITLCVGMVLMAVTAGLPEALRTVSAGIRDLAFAGMGASLLRDRTLSMLGNDRRPNCGDEPAKLPRPSQTSTTACTVAPEVNA